jgi:hypothetical protein
MNKIKMNLAYMQSKLSKIEQNNILAGGNAEQATCAGCLCDSSKGDMSTNNNKATSSAD